MSPMLTDSHTHLYMDTFDSDREDMIGRAMDAGISRMCLPNIDSGTIHRLYDLTDRYPGNCFPMMGLHPTSVKENYRTELEKIEAQLTNRKFIAIGETGIDLYWDKTYFAQQVEAFRTQIGWAREMGLPVVIHARNSFTEIFSILEEEMEPGLSGVFHSFTGTKEELNRALSFGFMIGINGIVTFKNSDLENLIPHIPGNKLLLETDAPFLAPVPHRGKRNESSYLIHVAEKIAGILDESPEQIATMTTENASIIYDLYD